MKPEFYVYNNQDAINETAKFFIAGLEFEKIFEKIINHALDDSKSGYNGRPNREWEQKEYYWVAFDIENKFGKYLLENNIGLYHKAPNELYFANEEDVIALRYCDLFNEKTETMITKRYKARIMRATFEILTELGIEAKIIRNPNQMLQTNELC